MKKRYYIGALCLAALALTSVLGLETGANAQRGKVADLSVFTKTTAPTTDQISEKAAILREIDQAPKESSAHGIDASLLRPIEVPGEDHHAWIAPTAAGGLAIFTPTDDFWAYAHSSWEQLSGDGAIAIAGGKPESDGSSRSIAVVVATDGASEPTLSTESGVKRAMNYTDNVAVAKVKPGDIVTSGGTKVKVVDPKTIMKESAGD